MFEALFDKHNGSAVEETSAAIIMIIIIFIETSKTLRNLSANTVIRTSLQVHCLLSLPYRGHIEHSKTILRLLLEAFI